MEPGGMQEMTVAATTAAAAGLVGCHSCNLLSKAVSTEKHAVVTCPRCGAALHARKPNSIARTWALVIAAYICYIPANLLPMTVITSLGNTQEDTIMSGVIYFLLHGEWPIGLVIFVASVVVPVAKLFTLTYLLISVQRKSQWQPQERARLYRMTEAVGRWSMTDIYVVTILVALVSLGNLATIEAGPGAIFFGAVVIITIFAAMSFDPRKIWDNMEPIHDKPAS
ncbi:MAG: paraquat-inducible protein A [Gammaproteobacteria bacterium]|nr:MAG: paraquat-inducible protein A [Gammaproteobacteria bacterium]